ncbi:16121_t:CDS:1, partial [Gigaspora margarita]
GLHLDGYNEELGLAFEYSGNQYYQIVPFFHPQGQMNLDRKFGVIRKKGHYATEKE